MSWKILEAAHWHADNWNSNYEELHIHLFGAEVLGTRREVAGKYGESCKAGKGQQVCHSQLSTIRTNSQVVQLCDGGQALQ
jgi:hypothetical protein